MTERRKTGERPILKRRRFWALAALALLVLACVLWTADYYRAGEAAMQALESDAVRVEETDFGWLFDGPAEDAALIFYPGGKVEETAYAPLLHRLAAEGPDVFLVRMPLHLAVLREDAADDILARYDYARWIIGGHSLGGAVAANYAALHEMDGVILLAAYPTHALDEPMLLIVGSEDGVVSRERLDAVRHGGKLRDRGRQPRRLRGLRRAEGRRGGDSQPRGAAGGDGAGRAGLAAGNGKQEVRNHAFFHHS